MNKIKKLTTRVQKEIKQCSGKTSFEFVVEDGFEVGYVRFKVFNGVYKDQIHVVRIGFICGNGDDQRVFPLDPPSLTFLTKIWHPNIGYPSGIVCLDTINVQGQWVPSCGVEGIVTMLTTLLECPNTESPQNSKGSAQFEKVFDYDSPKPWIKICSKYYEKTDPKEFERFTDRELTPEVAQIESDDESELSSLSDLSELSESGSYEIPAPAKITKKSKKSNKSKKSEKKSSKSKKSTKTGKSRK